MMQNPSIKRRLPEMVASRRINRDAKRSDKEVIQRQRDPGGDVHWDRDPMMFGIRMKNGKGN